MMFAFSIVNNLIDSNFHILPSILNVHFISRSWSLRASFYGEGVQKLEPHEFLITILQTIVMMPTDFLRVSEYAIIYFVGYSEWNCHIRQKAQEEEFSKVRLTFPLGCFFLCAQ